MNMFTFNANELDVIYDAIIMHMQCTDDDNSEDICHNIINKMHIHDMINQNVV